MSERSETVIRLVAEIGEVDPSSLDTGMDLVGDVGFDSAKAMRLLVEVEEAFDIEVPDEAAAKLSTIGDVIAFVESAT